MDNVIVTPHGLSMTDQLWKGIWNQILRQISEIMCGKIPEALVNGEVLDSPEFQSKIKAFQKSVL